MQQRRGHCRKGVEVVEVFFCMSTDHLKSRKEQMYLKPNRKLAVPLDHCESSITVLANPIPTPFFLANTRTLFPRPQPVPIQAPHLAKVVMQWQLLFNHKSNIFSEG